MRRLLAMAAICAAPVYPRGAQGQPARPGPRALQEYRLDAGHSIVEFSIPFLYSRVKGRFTQTHGTMLYDPAEPANSSVTVILESKSLDTGWPHRDEHLRTSDFFDVERYPTILFQSERLHRSPQGWVAEGPLTMHGVTKQIAIPFHLVQPPTRDPNSRWMMLNAAGAVRLARKDFGIVGGSAFNSWFTAARSATMADSVDVSLEVEGYLSDEAGLLGLPPIEAALERVRANGIDAEVARLRESRKTKTPGEWKNYFRGPDLLVRALIATNRTREAVTLARALTELFPESASAWVDFGYALAVSGDARGAADQYAKARDVFRPTPPDPNEKFPQVDENWYWLDLLAIGAVEAHRVPEAVALARAIAELYPSTARAHVTYGYALAAAGEARGAGEQYAKALELDPLETRALELQRRLVRARP